MNMADSLPSQARDRPAIFSECSEGFYNARRELHKLMQRWDDLLPGEDVPGGKDEGRLVTGVGDGLNGDLAIYLHDGKRLGRDIGRGGDEGFVLVLKVEVVNCPQGG